MADCLKGFVNDLPVSHDLCLNLTWHKVCRSDYLRSLASCRHSGFLQHPRKLPSLYKWKLLEWGIKLHSSTINDIFLSMSLITSHHSNKNDCSVAQTDFQNSAHFHLLSFKLPCKDCLGVYRNHYVCLSICVSVCWLHNFHIFGWILIQCGTNIPTWLKKIYLGHVWGKEYFNLKRQF